MEQNGPGIYYIVYYKRSDSNEKMKRQEVRGSNFTILGTRYDEEYQVQVQAANLLGFGPKSPIIVGWTGDMRSKLQGRSQPLPCFCLHPGTQLIQINCLKEAPKKCLITKRNS